MLFYILIILIFIILLIPNSKKNEENFEKKVSNFNILQHTNDMMKYYILN